MRNALVGHIIKIAENMTKFNFGSFSDLDEKEEDK